MEIELKGTILSTHAQPYTIELERSQKGYYAWTVKVHASNPQNMLEQLSAIDSALLGRYGTNGATPAQA